MDWLGSRQRGLFRGSAGESADDNQAVLAGMLDEKTLPDVREVEIVAQRRCAPDAPHLDAPVGEVVDFFWAWHWREL